MQVRDSTSFSLGLRGMLLLAAFLVHPLAAHAADPLLGLNVSERLAADDRAGAIDLVRDAALVETDRATKIDLLSQLAELEMQAGRHADAAATLSRVVDEIALGEDGRPGQNSPELLPVLRRLAEAQEAAGKPEAVVAALDRAITIARIAGIPDAADALRGWLSAIASGSDEAAATAARTALSAQDEASRSLEARLEESSRSFEPDIDKTYTTVRIYYATDRDRTGSELPNDFYGGGRGTGLELGIADVSIPEHHRPGQIEAPSIWTFDLREDPERHVVLQSVVPRADEEVFAAMRQQAADSGSSEAFVFVHGFNVPFNEAAKRTAQMAFDMDFDGLPILYSWPSRGSLLSYISDTAVVNLSGRRLSRFLDDVVARSGAKRIHLIAHSMGNRALTDALELFALRHKGEPPAFDQVLFTAPDLDAGLFSEMLATIRPAAERITLYASDKDWALAVSRKLHGDAPRAGQGGIGILHLATVDSIDMTEIGEDMLKHSYYANNPSALTDILSLFWRDAAPDQRCGMSRAEGDNGSYWQYAPAACDGATLLPTLSYLRRGSVATIEDARNFANKYILPTTADPALRQRLDQALRRLFTAG